MADVYKFGITSINGTEIEGEIFVDYAEKGAIRQSKSAVLQMIAPSLPRDMVTPGSWFSNTNGEFSNWATRNNDKLIGSFEFFDLQFPNGRVRFAVKDPEMLENMREGAWWECVVY